MSKQDLSKKEAALILEVTPSSIGHWLKLGYLEVSPRVQGYVDAASLERLKERMALGSVPKLRARANKAQAGGFFAPFALDIEAVQRENFDRLADFVLGHRLPAAAVLFCLALNLAAASLEEETRKEGAFSCLWEAVLNGRRPQAQGLYQEGGGWKGYADFSDALAAELFEFWVWLEDSGVCLEEAWESTALADGAAIGLGAVWRTLLYWELPSVPDILGVVYQVCTQENIKVKKGAYFTPRHVVEAMAADNWTHGADIFDPCCGAGRFLLGFAARGAEPENLWGMDIDPLAVFLTRINLLLFYRRSFRPQVYCGNSLRWEEWKADMRAMAGGFDVVATNPPWGARVELGDRSVLPEELRNDVSLAGFGRESFSLFLLLGLRCLAAGGRLSFLLPEAFLMVKRHETIRRFVLDHCAITKIMNLGTVFCKVVSAAVRMDVVKAESAGREGNNGGCSVEQRRFAANADAVFNIWTSREDEVILRKIEDRPHLTLAGHARWALGIVTGDNARALSDTAPGKTAGERKEQKQKRDDRETEGASAPGRRAPEGVLRGCDVSPFRLKEPSCFLRFEPAGLQQAAEEFLYRAPKLVYRFISTRPVVAYDADGRLTLNSANSVVVKLEGYPVRAVEALFNSRLYAYLFYHKFHALKVLRGHLERLPLPAWPVSQLEKLAGMAETLSSLSLSEEGRVGLEAELEQEIMLGFGLNPQEQARIRACVRG